MSAQLHGAEQQLESNLLKTNPTMIAGSHGRSVQQGLTVNAVSMLREAVNLSPPARPSLPSNQAPLDPEDEPHTISDTEEPETGSRLAADTAQESCERKAQQGTSALGLEGDAMQLHHGKRALHGHKGLRLQQGQESGREAGLLREAYRDMLLQQQTRHRTDLQKRQAKHQRQLEAQAKAHEEALSGLIQAGYTKPCSEGDMRLSGPLPGQVKMLLEENAALQGNLQALKEDIGNRVDYALWQQRQAHEASLGQIYQQHAQDLQAAGPAAQQMHEEEVKTLISEAVQANEVDHAADVQHLRSQCDDCEADLKERDRQYSALLRELKAIKRRYRSTASSSVSSEENNICSRLDLDKLLGPCTDDSPPCHGSPPSRAPHSRHPLRQSQHTHSPKGSHSSRRRAEWGKMQNAQATCDESVESPMTSMVNAVLGNRHRQAEVSPKSQASGQKHAPFPQLQQGNASPDTSHALQLRQSVGGAQQAASWHGSDWPTQQQDKHQAAPMLQTELSFSPKQHMPAKSSRCLRCGSQSAEAPSECKFHPALLKDPGPLLYSPEWHACRAAKHTIDQPGCYVRQGHYFPGHAVQHVSGEKQHATPAGSLSSAHHMQPQPRTHLPVPVASHK